MSSLRISVSVATTIPTVAAVNAATFPHLSAAVRDVLDRGLRLWTDYAAGAPLPDGRSLSTRTGAYARSISVERKSDFAGRIFTDLPYAAALENGTAARDLHDMLGSSLKVRIAKDGRRYLIIPFRSYHSRSVIGARMPAAIENWWRGVPHTQSSRIRAHTWRSSGTGAVAFRTSTTGTHRLARGETVEVRARKYTWGTRLSAAAIRGMGLGEEAVRRYAGMVRFQRPKTETGKGGGHAQFISFRTLKEGSGGWRVPARPGYHVAKAVAEQLRPFAEAAIREAVTRDVRALLAGGKG